MSILAISLAGCGSPAADPTPTQVPAPEQAPMVADSTPEVQTGADVQFGDGFTARVSGQETSNISNEEIVELLMTQFLEHYKMPDNTSNAAITDYTVDNINVLEVGTSESDYQIVAGVRFSIVPAHKPNDWASMPGDISPDDPWWHLAAPFGVFQDGDSLGLRLVFGWRT